jgi:predicted metalloprotease with PDZ domain
MDDLRSALASVSGDDAFAREFFRRYVEGRELVDYETLLAAGGIALRPLSAQPSVGAVRLMDSASGVRVATAVPFGSPLYEAGIDRDDVIVSVAGRPIATVNAWNEMLQGRKPGDAVPIDIRRRNGTAHGTLTIGRDVRVQAVPLERVGQALTPAQRAFRDAWLNSQSGTR